MSLKASAVSTSAVLVKKKSENRHTTSAEEATMDWLKLFALLVAVASLEITADAPKKKIRIHLPQKVKHIHHHKKIYITNHPASSQYAPAFMPSAEGAVAVPSNVAMPAVASLLPINSVELYDESPTRLPGIASAASKLLPLYRARGYYGPKPTEWDEQDYDHAESSDESYLPTAFAAPSPTPTASSNYQPKRVKLVKINEAPRKKLNRKHKPKRVAVRNKPLAQLEDEHPVTTFHEQFYSDIDGSGAIRKIKKPQRVEKIIDGDTEHIHTYSEEHIHKLVFDDGSKRPVIAGLDSVEGLSALASSHPLVPIKNPQNIIAIPPDALTRFTAIGSMGTPSHLEYAAYNPRDVTHDHIFHDHGEIPSGVDLTKDHLPFPPRLTNVRQGLKNGLGAKGHKGKHQHKYLKTHSKPNPLAEYPYFENMYAQYNKIRNLHRPTIATAFEPSNEASLEEYRPSFKVKNKANVKHRSIPTLYFGHGKQILPQSSASSPYSISTAVVHQYKPRHYPDAAAGLSKINDFLYNSNNNYEFDALASSSNIHPTAENYPLNFPIKKGKKKSISTQNVSFGGLDHQTTVDHLQDSGISASSLNGIVPSAFDSSYDNSKLMEAPPSTAYTIRDTSPAHPYYSAMAVKALHGGDQQSLAEASNNNYQYADAPSPTTPPKETTAATTVGPTAEYFEITSSESMPTESTNYDTRAMSAINEQSSEVLETHHEPRSRYKILPVQLKGPTRKSQDSGQDYYRGVSVSPTGKFKYGDKI